MAAPIAPVERMTAREFQKRYAPDDLAKRYELVDGRVLRVPLLGMADAIVATGLRLFWDVDTWRRTVTVYAADGAPHVVGQGGTLGGAAVLPGPSVPVAELFDGLNDPAA